MKTLLPLVVLAAIVVACGTERPQISQATRPSPPATPAPTAPTTRPLAATPSALPSFSAAAPIPGRIAFNTDDHAIWVMNGDGNGARRVSNPGSDGNDFDPRWSPEGDAITFRSSRGVYGPDPYSTGTEGIWIIDMKSGRERQLFPRDAKTIGGLFADPGPNGLVALSTVDIVDGTPHEVITLVDRAGKRVKTFDLDGGECSMWSPDGSLIAYCRHEGGFSSSDSRFAVWLMNADGGERRRLSTSEGSADPDAWSPDGRRMLYDSGVEGSRHVFVTNVDGTNQKQLTDLPGTQVAVAWLPDGRIIFKWSPSDSATARWLTMSDDGSEMAEIAAFEQANVTALVWHP